MNSPDVILRELFGAAVASAQPAQCVPANLPEPGSGRTLVVGAGKAAAAMARAVEDHWSGDLSGLVITRYGHGVPCQRIEVVEASHPVPDAAGLTGAKRILERVSEATADDLVIVLMSGGASALLTLPAGDITLEEKQEVNRALLRSGATISEMNCVRKHLSAIKGGRLAQAANGARVVTLAISDVPGDDFSIIGSGPTVPDLTSTADAIAIVEKYGLNLPSSVARHLASEQAETPNAISGAHSDSKAVLIAAPAVALAAAAEVAESHGLAPIVIGDAIEGEARDVAIEHAAQAATAMPGSVILSGGELTVTIRGDGKGGPNAEYALALAMALDGRPGVWVIACDTDGIDGSEDNAGALVRPDTLDRAKKLNLSPSEYLSRNDAYGFFSALDDLVVCGPTLTNVNDFRAILIT